MNKAELYNEAVKNHYNHLFRYVFKSLQDEDTAKDIVQDCYLKLWQHQESINPEKLKSWLFSVAHNAMINFIKKDKRNVPMEKNMENIKESTKPDFDLKELLDRTLDELPQLQKSILLLRDLEGYDYKEIGEILQLSDQQVKVYLFRARQKMKDKLKSLSSVLI